MSNPHVRVSAVSDYICPWCYVGLARIERLQREFELEVVWQPFELHPEIPPEGKELRGRARAYYEQLAPLAREAGFPFEPPARVPNSHRALEAAEFAREHGAFDAYHRALFGAYFARSEDIGDIDVLTRLGETCGLDAGALRDALASRRYATLVDERTEQARQNGISGTPTFVFQQGERRLALVGAQEERVFENIAQRLGAERRTTTAVVGRGP